MKSTPWMSPLMSSKSFSSSVKRSSISATGSSSARPRTAKAEGSAAVGLDADTLLFCTWILVAWGDIVRAGMFQAILPLAIFASSSCRYTVPAPWHLAPGQVSLIFLRLVSCSSWAWLPCRICAQGAHRLQPFWQVCLTPLAGSYIVIGSPLTMTNELIACRSLGGGGEQGGARRLEVVGHRVHARSG